MTGARTGILLLVLLWSGGAAAAEAEARPDSVQRQPSGSQQTVEMVRWLAQRRQFTIAGIPYGFTGLPVLYYSQRTGWNYGARLQWADYRRRPYRYKFLLHAVRSTGGKIDYFVRLKVPRISGTLFGVLLQASMERNIRTRYYGRGNGSVYNKAFVKPGNPQFKDENYYFYILEEPRFLFSLLRQLSGPVSMSAGLGLERTDIDQRGEQSYYMDVGTPDGVVGGATGFFSATLEWDSRDDDTVPLVGTFHEWSYETSRNSLLALFLEEIDFQRYTFTDARYRPLSERLNLAHRTIFEVLDGSIPLYAYGEIGGSRRVKGLGGSDTLRGFDTQRFTDNIRFFTNTEMRYRLRTTRNFGQHLEWHGVLFVDTGRVWHRLSELRPAGLRWTAGLGGRVYWNADFVIRLDLGFSAEQNYVGIKYRNLF